MIRASEIDAVVEERGDEILVTLRMPRPITDMRLRIKEDKPVNPLSVLTVRQRKVLELQKANHTLREIAHMLGYSRSTIGADSAVVSQFLRAQRTS